VKLCVHANLEIMRIFQKSRAHKLVTHNTTYTTPTQPFQTHNTHSAAHTTHTHHTQPHLLVPYGISLPPEISRDTYKVARYLMPHRNQNFLFGNSCRKFMKNSSKNAQRHEKSIAITFSVQTHRNQKLSSTNCEPQNRKLKNTPFW